MQKKNSKFSSYVYIAKTLIFHYIPPNYYFLVIVAVINPLEIINFSIILAVQQATYLGAAIGTNTSALALKETVSQRNEGR